MTELQQSRYDSLLRRVGDLKGPGSKVNDVLQELFPMFDVENVPSELMLLGGWRLGLGGTQVVPGVGNVGRIQLFNPAGSGKLIVVTRLMAAMSSTQRIRFSVGSTALTTGVGINNTRDTRGGAAILTTAQLRTDATVAKTDSQGTVLVTTNSTIQIEDQNGIAVLSPGNGFEVGGDVTNTTITATLFYRERVAEPSELNF